MKTAAFLAFLAGSAAAFAPSQSSTIRTSSIKAASFDTDPGRANDVLGMWDPLNMVNGEQKNFDRLRASEIKNGRVAMMGECVCVCVCVSDVASSIFCCGCGKVFYVVH